MKATSKAKSLSPAKPKNSSKLVTARRWSRFPKRQLAVVAVLCSAMGSYVVYASLAATVVGTLQAEAMALSGSASVVTDAAASGGNAVRFTATGSATGTLATTAASDTVTVAAKGVQCKGAPALQLTLDGKAYTASVSTTSYKDYQFAVPLVAGNHSVAVAFTNPLHKSGCTRQLTVDVVRAMDTSTTPPPSDTVAPTVSLTQPANGSTVSATTTVSASASDNVGVTKVEFYLNGNVVSTVNASPFNYIWDTTTVANGSYSLSAKAYDAAGNVGTSAAATVTVSNTTAVNSAAPSPDGYFATAPVGAWSSLPSGSQCSQMINRSTWEPRPENATENATMPNAQAVHDALASRPRGSEYNANWDSWLLPRVDGQFTGTTDEIIQWAACKWGISDNLLRGQAVRESTWYQVLHFADGQCYWDRGCGDSFSGVTADSKVYCNGLATYGHDYQTDTNSTYGAYPYAPQSGLCPKTFSIIGIMSWENPTWVAPAPPYAGNQNGTFPFNRDSTAFAMDYEASYLRGCQEGWIKWLAPAGGDIWGCVGAWYAGDWHSAAADGYISRVQAEITNHTWLTSTFAVGKANQYKCDPVKGCPQ